MGADSVKVPWHIETRDRIGPVVCVQPPFFRLLGSHNDRAPLDLAYLVANLAHVTDATLLNLDASGGDVFWDWSTLYERSHLLAADRITGSPHLLEAVEQIVRWNPGTVVIAAGDALTPWVDLGNAFVASELAVLLRSVVEVPIVGVGPRFADLGQLGQQGFTAVYPSAHDAHEALVGRGVSLKDFHSVPLRPDLEWTTSKYDVVMTAIGCPRECSFCDAAAQSFHLLPIEHVTQDLTSRGRGKIDIGDAIFLPSPKRAMALEAWQEEAGTELSCELTVEHATPERLSQLHRIGVRAIKIGLEAADQGALVVMNKRSSADEALSACRRIKEAGMRLTVYVLLGGPVPRPRESARATLDLCLAADADEFVVNVWAYNPPVASTDCHFSWDLVERYGLASLMPRFFELPHNKPSLGRFISCQR